MTGVSTTHRRLSRVLAVVVAARLVLVFAAHYWNVGQLAAGHPLTRAGVTDNAGDGIDWLFGQVVVPLLAISLVVLGALTRDRRVLGRSVLILTLAIGVIGLGMVALSVPALAALEGLGEIGLAVLAWRTADPDLASRTADFATESVPVMPSGT